jgi:hypothetical protein
VQSQVIYADFRNAKEPRESDHSARLEAKSIVCAINNGVDITDALTMSKTVAQALKLFCKKYPNEAYIVLNAVTYRAKVKHYVDLILAGQDWGDEKNGEEENSEDIEVPPDISAEVNAPAQGEEESAIPEAQA